MSKRTHDRDLATVSIKISLTPAEAALVESARDAEDERKTGTWVRKVTLRAARAVLTSSPVPVDKPRRGR